MEIHSLTPNIMVQNVKQTAENYTQLFGFKVINTVPNTQNPEIWDWAMLQGGENAFIMLQEEQSLRHEITTLKNTPLGGSLNFFVKIKGVQELYEKLKNTLPIVKDLETTFYNAIEFSVQEHNGYVFTFAEFANED